MLVVKTTHKMFLRAYVATKANLTTWKLEKEGGQREESLHLIGINEKQKKKTLERRDEVTTFCLTVNEKKTHNKENNYRSKAPHKQHQKTMPQMARYSNPLEQCKESHADRREAMLNRQVSCHKHAVILALHKTKTI